MTLQSKTESPDGITPTEWELYVDGLRVLSAKPMELLRWDTRPHSNGTHVLTVLARGNDPAQTIGMSPSTR